MSILIMGMGAEEGRGHPFVDPRKPGLSVLLRGGTSPAGLEFPWAAVHVDKRLLAGVQPL